MDLACRHHDHYRGFYEDWGIESLGIAQGCIVRAATEQARLTSATGAVVPYDISSEASVTNAFQSMPRTGSALYYFWWWGSSGCPNPGAFLDATTSKR